jgi:hypothetical protein
MMVISNDELIISNIAYVGVSPYLSVATVASVADNAMQIWGD